MYRVTHISFKKFSGKCEDTADSDKRIRELTFKKLSAAQKGFEEQVTNAVSVMEFSKRHRDTCNIQVVITLLYENVVLDQWDSEYSNERSES